MTTQSPTAGRSPSPSSTGRAPRRTGPHGRRFPALGADRGSEGSGNGAVAPRRRPACRQPRVLRGILRRCQQPRPAATHSRTGLGVDPERRERAGRGRASARVATTTAPVSRQVCGRSSPSKRRVQAREGDERIRTAVRGFAGLCLTTRPRRRCAGHASRGHGARSRPRVQEKLPAGETRTKSSRNVRQSSDPTA